LTATSEDGLDFIVDPNALIEEPGDGVSPQDPFIIEVNGELRMYYGLYKGPEVVPESGIYSAVKID
jgi:hypothetical protein